MSQTLLLFHIERPKAVRQAVHALSEAESRERGAIHTRSDVVAFILNLVGYEKGRGLLQARLLEPSCGTGDFVVLAVDRLLTCYEDTYSDFSGIVDILSDAIRAVELNGGSLKTAKARTTTLLLERGVPKGDAKHLVNRWFVQDDFLLADFDHRFTHVVGNPPYVRQELIPEPLLAIYRRRFETIYDRADLYIPFIERSLSLLEEGGVLGFICSDRWVKNRYGGPLRRMIAKDFHLRSYVDMTNTAAFQSNVSAYPGIFVIAREKGSTTRIARQADVEANNYHHLALELGLSKRANGRTSVREVRGIAQGAEPWLLDAPEEVALLRRLEAAYPLLEETGCTVGIGVASGLDKVFIRKKDELPVEETRRVPIITAKEIRSGQIASVGKYILNPFETGGTLADLSRYPRFAAYLRSHEAQIKKRHVAKKNPNSWYRTIDRIYPDLVKVPKLLIPDIKGSVQVVFDEGWYYPHHNLYYVTSDRWDIRALQAVLRSSVAEFFVAMYSVKMRGGYLRYQAQYLRRIRLPEWEKVPTTLRKQLARAAESPDRKACNEAAYALYELDEHDQRLIEAVIYSNTSV